MKPFKGYEEAKVITQKKKLPKGGYILKILEAVEKKTSNGGSYLEISFDIAEGEFKGYYAEAYKNNTNEDKKWSGKTNLFIPQEDDENSWSADKFKTFMTAVESSNKKYTWNWDETTLKNKLVGAIFNEKEYNFNGRQGFTAQYYGAMPIEAIKNGEFEIPQPTLLKGGSAQNTGDSNGFMNIPEGLDEELPFN